MRGAKGNVSFIRYVNSSGLVRYDTGTGIAASSIGIAAASSIGAGMAPASSRGAGTAPPITELAFLDVPQLARSKAATATEKILRVFIIIP